MLDSEKDGWLRPTRELVRPSTHRLLHGMRLDQRDRRHVQRGGRKARRPTLKSAHERPGGYVGGGVLPRRAPRGRAAPRTHLGRLPRGHTAARRPARRRRPEVRRPAHRRVIAAQCPAEAFHEGSLWLVRHMIERASAGAGKCTGVGGEG